MATLAERQTKAAERAAATLERIAVALEKFATTVDVQDDVPAVKTKEA